MTIFQGFILGLTQGLTEFLPVSSSGHLVIFQHLLNLSEPPVVFDVFVHLATSLAVIIVIFDRLIKISFKQIKVIVFASLPAALGGVVCNSQIEQLFSSLKLVGFALLATSGLLFSTKLVKKQKFAQLNYQNTFLIGLSQALAIIPGISRSGSTIVTALHTNLSPLMAFNFSFLLSLPAIFGAQLLQLNKLVNLSLTQLPVLLVGFASAFVSGLMALKLLKRFVVKAKLHYFGYYCLILGLITLIFS